MDDKDAALFAIVATAYATKMQQAKRPEWLVLAFLALVRGLRRTLPIHALGASSAVYNAALTTAINRLAVSLTQYVALQIPSGGPIHPMPVAAELRHALSLAVAKAQRDVIGKELAQRIALIVQAETQTFTAKLTQRAIASGNVEKIQRETHSDNPCPRCDGLAGEYTAPFDPGVFYTHPRCACSWTEVR